MAQSASEIALEEVSCPSCNSDARSVVLVAPDLNFAVPGTFTIARCNDCGLCYVSPRPTAATIAAAYPETYAAGYENADGARHLAAYTKRLRVIKSVLPTGRVLEVGCAAGHFLHCAQLAGYEVSGVEFDPRSAQYAKSHYGLNVTESCLEAAELPPNSFDVVCLFDVFEHIPRPVEALRKIGATLKPGATLVLQVPNFECLESHIWGRYWYGKDLPRDILHFSPKTLHDILRRVGIFCDIEIRHNAEPNYGVMSAVRCLRSILTGRPQQIPSLEHPHQARRPTNTLQQRIFTVLTTINSPLVKMLALLGQGNSLIALARKG